MSSCCVSGFQWNGSPSGKETKLAGNDAYVTGTNKDVALLVIHDMFGWTFPNLRLLADHYAKEVDATVYVPDYFGGEVVPIETLANQERENFDIVGFIIGRNGKEKRFPEIEAGAKALKHDLGFKKVGAMGFCYGGWAVFQLGNKKNKLVDCISTAHPSLLTKEEMANVGVPVQILAPEHDPAFVPELKTYAKETIPTRNVEFDYQHFPGVAHGFATRCNEDTPHEKHSLERAKNAAVAWFGQHLHLS